MPVLVVLVLILIGILDIVRIGRHQLRFMQLACSWRLVGLGKRQSGQTLGASKGATPSFLSLQLQQRQQARKRRKRRMRRVTRGLSSPLATVRSMMFLQLSLSQWLTTSSDIEHLLKYYQSVRFLGMHSPNSQVFRLYQNCSTTPMHFTHTHFSWQSFLHAQGYSCPHSWQGLSWLSLQVMGTALVAIWNQAVLKLLALEQSGQF